MAAPLKTTLDTKIETLPIDAEVLNRISERLFGKKLSITDAQIQDALDPVKNAYSKKVIGGTAPEEVERQLKVIEKALIRDEALIAEHEAKLAAASEKLESQVEALVSKY